MNIIWKPVVNYWEGRQGITPIAIVNHIMEGTLRSTYDWFNNPTSEASSHFGIGKRGEQEQYVALTNTAWTNYPSKNPAPNLSWIRPNINPNLQTITIEHEGYHEDGLTEEQYQATLEIHLYILGLYPHIPRNRNHIVGHFEINSVDRANCPGKKFSWKRLMYDLNYAPNPKKFSVGEGVLKKLEANRLTATTNEQYLTNNHDNLQSSRTWAIDYTDTTYQLQAFQESDLTWQKFELWKYERSL